MYQKPEWLRVRCAYGPEQKAVEEILKRLGLNTVCREASCPNKAECYSRKTATFLVLGTRCTRGCRFCDVSQGVPMAVDSGEPWRVAMAVRELGLTYVVITSVTRDDLPDGGAAHFAEVICEIQRISPQTAVEVLIPDLMGDMDALKVITNARPNVISHNLETVPALYPDVRPHAEYDRSLAVIRGVKELNRGIHSKSGIMLGLGESDGQVYKLMDDLRAARCDFLTIGQYLPPSCRHVPLQEYLQPSRFEEYGKVARDKGFAFVASAPLVRSSYHAGEAMEM